MAVTPKISPKVAQKLLAKRQAQLGDPNKILADAFDKQLAFIQDPARLKALFCTRRASKSFTCGLYMVYEAITNPGCNCLFLALTRQSAYSIIWKDVLKVLNHKHKLKAKFNETKLSMTLPNVSVHEG